MDKLKSVLSGREDEEETGIVAQVNLNATYYQINLFLFLKL